MSAAEYTRIFYTPLFRIQEIPTSQLAEFLALCPKTTQKAITKAFA